MLHGKGRLSFLFNVVLISLHFLGFEVQAEVFELPAEAYMKNVIKNTLISSKTIETLKENIDSIDLEITGNHGYRFRTTIDFCDEGNGILFNELLPGTYTIKFKARDKSNKVLFTGENTVNVVEGENTFLHLNMEVQKTYPAEFRLANMPGNYSNGNYYFVTISFDDNTNYYARAVYREGAIHFSIDRMLINKKGRAVIGITDDDSATHYSNIMVDIVEMIGTGNGFFLPNKEGTGRIDTSLIFSKRNEGKEDIFPEDRSLKTDGVKSGAGLRARVKKNSADNNYYLYINNGEAYRYILLGRDTLLRLKLIKGDINQGLFLGLESADEASFNTWANVNLYRYNAAEIFSKNEVYSFQNFHGSRCEIDIQEIDRYILLISKVKLFYGANKFIDIILFDNYGNRIIQRKISRDQFPYMDTLLPDLIVTDVDDVTDIQKVYENISPHVTSRIADNELIVKFATRGGKVFTFNFKIGE